MRVILDCSTVDTAISSLSQLFGKSDNQFRQWIAACDIDWSHPRLPPEDQLARYCGHTDRRAMPSPVGVRWFHATRAVSGSMFEEGLLPTEAALEPLWEHLGRLLARKHSAAEWAAYRRSFETSHRHFADQFRRKQIDPGWQGPFAFLVRDAATGRCGNHKDFTQMCEVLEDICGDYEEVFGESLSEPYAAATRACLVAFTRPGDWPNAVSAALNYVHRSIRHLDHGFECNANFNGRGVGVPSSWIDGVEWL